MRHVELVNNELAEYVVPDLEDVIQSEMGIPVTPSDVAGGGCVTVSSGVSGARPAESHASWELLEDTDFQPTEIGDTIAGVADVSTGLTDDVAAIPIHVFDRVLEQAHIANLNASQSSLPWESGVHAAIFSETWEPAQLNQLTFAVPPPAADIGGEEPEEVVAAAVRHLKRKKDGAVCDTIIKSIADVDFKQEKENLWNRGLNKWILVYSCIQFSGDIGTRVWNRVVLEQDVGAAMEVLRDVLGAKSPKTINKRANSMLALIDWLNKNYKFSWPFDIEFVLEYMSEPKGGKPVASKGRTLMEAFRFCRHVLQIGELDQLAADPQLSGRAKRLDCEKTEYKQARPLTLKEVQFMERYMESEAHERDKYVMGAALFALFSRSRWSDLAMVQHLELDSTEVDGKPFGFVESSTKFQKTGTTALKRSSEMPLVAPVLGTTEVPWCHRWFDIMMGFGFDLSSYPFGPVCKAPAGSGEFFRRSVTSTEITDFLNNVLELSGEECVTSHSLKCTTLSWCSKYGLDEPTRTLLGHHELPGKSMQCYSRDLLARPLAKYQAMLMNVRSGSFLPDCSRSGRFVERAHELGEDSELGDLLDKAARPWKSMRRPTIPASAAFELGGMTEALISKPSSLKSNMTELPSPLGSEISPLQLDTELVGHVENPPDTGDAVAVSDSSSDSSSSSESVEEEHFVERVMPDGIHKDTLEELYQHKKSRVLHRPGAGAGALLCGRKINENYRHLKEGASFKWARCTGCFRGEVITSSTQVADALDSLRAKRA